jgi:hypothetical protein
MSHSNRHLAQYGDLTWDDCRPDDVLTTGFFCPEHGITADYRVVPGSLLPHCHHCDRTVTQIEDTGEEAF